MRQPSLLLLAIASGIVSHEYPDDKILHVHLTMEIRNRSELETLRRYSGFRFFSRLMYSIANIIAHGDMQARLKQQEHHV